jgi:hypothetical protein
LGQNLRPIGASPVSKLLVKEKIVRQRGVYAAVLIAALLAGCRSTGTAFNPPYGGNIVTLDILGTPTAIAYQTSAHGAWKLLPSGQTTFTIPGTAYGVAFTCPEDDLFETSASQRSAQVEEWQPTVVIQATTTDFNTVLVPCNGDDETEATLSGTYDATAFESTNQVDVDYDEVGGGGTGSYSIDVTPGTQDVFGEAWDGDTLLAFKTIPSLNVPAGGATENITFSNSDAVGSSKTISWTNVPGTNEEEYSYLDFGSFDVSPEIGSSDSSSITYPTIAAGDIASDDSYYAESESEVDGPGNATAVEAAAFNPSLPTTIAFPDTWNSAGPTDSTQPSFSLHYTGYAGLTGGIQAYFLDEEWGTEGEQEGWTLVAVTQRYLTARGSSTYTSPDIALTGFSDMVPASGDIYPWAAVAFYGSPLFLQYFYFEGLDEVARGSGAQSLAHVPAAWGNGPTIQSSSSGATRSLTSGLRVMSSSNASTTIGIGDWSAAEGCTTIGTGAECEQP